MLKLYGDYALPIHEHMDDYPEHADLEVKTENNTIFVEPNNGEKVIIAIIG